MRQPASPSVASPNDNYGQAPRYFFLNPLDDINPMIIIHRIPSHREGRIAIVSFAGRGAVDAAASGAEFWLRAGTHKGP